MPNDSILNPTLFIGDFEWREPITTLTNLLVALVCIIAFLMYHKYKGRKSRGFNYFKFYFLFFAIAMIFAGWFGHGLQAYIGPEYKRVAWAIAATSLLLLALGTTTYLAEWVTKKVIWFIRISLTLQYLVFIVLMLAPQTSKFMYAQWSSVSVLIGFILPMHLYLYWKTKSKGNAIIIGTIMYGIIPGTVFNQQLSVGQWFNYHDISHVSMAVFMFLMYIGTSLLAMKDKPGINLGDS